MNSSPHLLVIGNAIKLQCYNDRISHEKLSEDSGIPISEIIDIESGKVDFTMNKLARLTAAMGYKVSFQLIPIDKKGQE